ncbi:MAG: hypothetical protein GY861_16165 [bacterium]|nr:hypothetical protein [bacterium]
MIKDRRFLPLEEHEPVEEYDDFEEELDVSEDNANYPRRKNYLYIAS